MLCGLGMSTNVQGPRVKGCNSTNFTQCLAISISSSQRQGSAGQRAPWWRGGGAPFRDTRFSKFQKIKKYEKRRGWGRRRGLLRSHVSAVSRNFNILGMRG